MDDLSLNKQYKSKDVALVLETGTFLLVHNSFEQKFKFPSGTTYNEKTNNFSLIGATENLSIGIDIKGTQISIDGMYQKNKPGDDYNDTTTQYSIGISLDIPIMHNSLTPIISFGGAIQGINWKNDNDPEFKYEIDETTFVLMFGFGVRYYINEHCFLKTSINYQRYTFNTYVENPYYYDKTKIDFRNQTIGLTFSLGYRF